MRRALPLILVLAGGCSWFSDDKGLIVDRTGEYLKARQLEPMQIPGDLQADRVEDPAPIPAIRMPMKPEYYDQGPPRPDAIHGDDSRDDVRIQRLGERRWLAIPEAPTTVWPKVKQFLAENGVDVAWENAREGRLDSPWVEISNQSYRDIIRTTVRDGKDAASIDGGLDRIRIRVEAGLRERTSEVHVRYENDGFGGRSADGVIDLDALASHNLDIEQNLLNELGAYVAARVSEQTVSMVAQDLGGGVKSYLDRDPEGEPILRLRVDFERAWATVEQSLTRAGIEIESSDRGTGVYVINVPENLEMVGDAEEKGWLRKLLTRDDDLTQLQLLVGADDLGNQTVRALAADGSQLDREYGQDVLVLLREFSS